MHDPSPYAGQTVPLRPDCLEVGGLNADVVDWFDRTGDQVSWRDAIATDTRAQSYAIRRSMAALPDDDQVLAARVDGMGYLIHCTEIVGETQAGEDLYTRRPVSAAGVGRPCGACGQLFVAGDSIQAKPLGPGADEQARANARAGSAYTPVTVALHWACATGDEN